MDNKCPRQRTPEEIEHTPAYRDISPAKKRKAHGSKPAASDSCGLFGAALAGAQKEVNMLFSQYSQVLSERAALESSQMRELEDILMEARGLEVHLKGKKEHLKRTLALISDKLQG